MSSGWRLSIPRGRCAAPLRYVTVGVVRVEAQLPQARQCAPAAQSAVGRVRGGDGRHRRSQGGTSITNLFTLDGLTRYRPRFAASVAGARALAPAEYVPSSTTDGDLLELHDHAAYGRKHLFADAASWVRHRVSGLGRCRLHGIRP